MAVFQAPAFEYFCSACCRLSNKVGAWVAIVFFIVFVIEPMTWPGISVEGIADRSTGSMKGIKDYFHWIADRPQCKDEKSQPNSVLSLRTYVKVWLGLTLLFCLIDIGLLILCAIGVFLRTAKLIDVYVIWRFSLSVIDVIFNVIFVMLVSVARNDGYPYWRNRCIGESGKDLEIDDKNFLVNVISPFIIIVSIFLISLYFLLCLNSYSLELEG